MGYLHYGAINQWDTLNLEPINIPRRGRCLGFTKGFSESLRQGQMGAYLVSLKELAQVSRRKDDGYLLSVEEKAQSQAFLDALLKLESEGLQESTWKKNTRLSRLS